MAMINKLRMSLFHMWFRLKRPMTLGVRVFLDDEDGKICLIRHTYTPGWHLPGGGVERGETCRDAAIKEVREEVGAIVKPEDMRLVSIHANFANFKGDHVLLYQARASSFVPTNSAHEIAEIGYFNPTNLPDGTTAGTRRRIGEILNSGSPSQTW
jgi:ADP-ribose pyrophosphatase YjhB (NUDIX family)